MVAGLYRRTMVEGFGGLTELSYQEVGWGDAEVAELMATLREVPCAGVVSLDLRGNGKLRSGEALAGIGQLTGLRRLNLSRCDGLISLPDTIGQLSALQKLHLDRCSGLASLPDTIGQLSGLQQLDLYGCSRLASLPDSIGQLSALQELTLGDGFGSSCTGLASMPDLSGLPGLEVKELPPHLKPWEAGGRKAWKKD